MVRSWLIEHERDIFLLILLFFFYQDFIFGFFVLIVFGIVVLIVGVIIILVDRCIQYQIASTIPDFKIFWLSSG